MSLAREFAAFVVTQRYADLPARAIDHARMLIASTIASAAVGSTIGSSQIIRAVEVERGGKPQATAWFGAAEKLPVSAAARVNALMSDAAASDDSDLRTIVHQGTTACASALAVAEHTGASGEDVLAAIVLGYEAAGRMSTALHHGFKTKGFHGCILASFASAVAAARLLGLSESQAAHAIALTATSMGGLSAAADSSWAREFHAGLAAMQGIQAAQAAAKGFVAEERVLEMRRGFFEVYGADADGPALTRDLGQRWSILSDLGIKLMPGGHPYHAIAEAAANAARDGNVSPGEVESIAISRPGYQGFGTASNPTDLIGIAHSPVYFAAAAVADREFTWGHASQDKIEDPTIRALLPKVRLVAPPTEAVERYLSGAIVTITTRNGRSHSSTVHAPRGAAILGIHWAEVEAKYRALVPHAGLSQASIEASLQAIRNFRTIRHVSALADLLRKGT